MATDTPLVTIISYSKTSSKYNGGGNGGKGHGTVQRSYISETPIGIEITAGQAACSDVVYLAYFLNNQFGDDGIVKLKYISIHTYMTIKNYNIHPN